MLLKMSYKVPNTRYSQQDAKNGHPGLFFVYFHLFKQTSQFLQQMYVKNVHPVHGAGIWTHNLQILSLLP